LRNLNNANVLAPSLLSIFVPFLAILSFHKRKNNFRRCCLFNIIHRQNSLLADGDYKLWDFYFGTENKSDWKSWHIFFKKEPFFHNSIKRKPNQTLYLGRNHFYQKGINNRTHFLIQNIT